MSSRLNQHFVPQYHFRLFTGGRRYVHVALRDGSLVAGFASIRGQCARHKLYGDGRVEEWLGVFEGRHSVTSRSVLEIVSERRSTPLSDDESQSLREAMLLQRARTPRYARVHATSYDQMVLDMYKDHLAGQAATARRDEIIRAIESGRARLRNTEATTLLLALEMASTCGPLISDLSVLLLRNDTTLPFIMGDSPSVFCNHYMRSVTDRGVTGLASAGLMAVLPLDSTTQVLLYDPAVYTPDYVTASGCIRVFERADVSMLNALQVHASEECVYFADANTEGYVAELLHAHGSLIQEPRGRFVVHKPGSLLIDGVPSTGEVAHIFEPQLPVTLDLSFLATADYSSTEPETRVGADELAKRIQEHAGFADRSGRIDIDELVGWVEDELVLPPGT